MRFFCRVCAVVLFVVAGIIPGLARSVPDRNVLKTQIGDATYYASEFHGRTTASGATFDKNKPMAAHRTFPFGTVVRVTNLRERRSVKLVIVDRGPYGKNSREGAIIDISQSAARKLGILWRGQAKVKIEVLHWGDGAHVWRS